MTNHRYIRAVSVYCGSQAGNDPVYMLEAFQLGALLARANIDVYFGGSMAGLMGALARGVAAQKGRLYGVFPTAFTEASARAEQYHEPIETIDVMGRKALMYDRSQAAIALPGALGTLDELMDRAAINDTLAIISRNVPLDPVIICNINGFYDRLWAQWQHMAETGFLKPDALKMFHMANAPEDAMGILHALDARGPVPSGVLRPRMG